MGSGRKIRTLPTKEKSDVSRTVNSSAPARNLTKNALGGVIFGCKHHTFDECLLKQIFGLPAAHYSYVKNVTPGLPIFLFNYSDRQLHGIFKATSPGQLNINPYAWITSEGCEKTPYAAQVRVDVRRQCRPLLEEEFKPIIGKNYYAKRLFWFELDKEQTQKLVKLFLSFPLVEKMPLPPKTAKRNNVSDMLSNSGTDVAVRKEFENVDLQEHSGGGDMKLREKEQSSVLFVNTEAFVPKNKWSELFQSSSSSYAENDKGMESREERVNLSMPDHNDMEWECASTSHEASKTHLQYHPDADKTESDSRDVECWEEHVFTNDAKESNGNEDAFLQYSDSTDMPSPENRAYDGEGGKLKFSEFESVVVKVPVEAVAINQEDARSGNALTPMEICRRYHNQLKTDGAFTGFNDATSGVVQTDTQSSDFESMIIKLTQEIEGLKVTQWKQKLKIDSLEQALAGSKLEIHQLKKWCCKLESIPSSGGDSWDARDCGSPNFPIDETVLIVGGTDGNSWIPDLCSYSPSQDRVISLYPMTFTRSCASVAKLHAELYIFGGFHDGVWYDTVESYNPMSNQWVQRPSLNKRKGSLAGASLYEKIFAIGGGTGVECFSEVELFDPYIGRWISTQPMLDKRFAPAAADINGALYVVGGYDGRDYLRSAERFDPREHAWTSLGSMNTKRGCHSLVAFKDKLYAIGGCDGDMMVSTVEVFDPRVGSWMVEEPMKVSRGYFGSFVFGGKIYVIGGVEDGRVLDAVECYDEGSGWQVTGLKAIGKRCFFSALVL